ncbi:MAG: S8/S53 family peptidase [Gemmatimonadaceae bacterium]|nr:S8/S53 family peptidase [Gemmatimonadaceae bacterium]
MRYFSYQEFGSMSVFLARFAAQRARIAVPLIAVVISVSCGEDNVLTAVKRAMPPSHLQSTVTLFLSGSGVYANPPVLQLTSVAPTSATAKYQDSPSVNFAGGNAWTAVGTWIASAGGVDGTVSTLGDAVLWIGLKNSDDQGTRFDVRVEAARNGAVFASGELRCVTDVVRNAAQASQISVPFASISPATFVATDSISLKVSARIGTDGTGAKCGGHTNATGLRVYFDATSRAARFDAAFGTAAPPAIPDTLLIPDDSTFTLTWGPDNQAVTYRRQFAVRFAEDAAPLDVAGFFSRFSATVVGGDPDMRTYVIQVPDPGADTTAFMALFDSLSVAPGVEAALRLHRVGASPALSSRFPQEGGGYTRAAWRTDADAVWHLNAIHAPEAWGCENGAYPGSSPPSVAVLEHAFAPHQDLVGRVTRTVRLSPPVGPGLAPEPSARFIRDLEHGRAVAAILSARTNNGVGVSGMLWGGDLTVYTTLNAYGLSAQTIQILQALRKDLRSHPTDYLSISTDWEPLLPLRTTERIFFDGEIRQLFVDNPSLTVVKAPGNDATVYSPGTITPMTPYLTAALVHLRHSQPSLASRLIWAAGSTRSRTIWGGSSWVTSQTAVAAPAESIYVLSGHVADAGGLLADEYALVNGTSISAPLITGTLALIRSFDPTLTVAEAYDYLIRGGRRHQRNPVTLQSFSPSQPTAHGEEVTIIDAYGSLALIGDERTSAPLCGVTVELQSSNQLAGSQDRVVVNRLDGGSPQTLLQLAPNEVFTDTPSFAQGGRRFSTWVNDANFNDVLREYSLVNGSWQLTASQPLGDRRRIYVEADTLYVPVVDDSTVLERRGFDGSVARLDLATSGAFSGFTGTVRVRAAVPSPDGRWVFMRVSGPAPCQFGAGSRAMLVSMKPAAGPPVILRDICQTNLPSIAAWSSDGRRLFGFGPNGRTEWVSTTTQGGWVEGATTSLGTATVYETIGTPEDIGTYNIELDGASCYRRLRSSVAPQTYTVLATGSLSCPRFQTPFLRAPDDPTKNFR